MKQTAKSQPVQQQRTPAAEPDRKPGQAQSSAFIDNRSEAIAQRKLSDAINSPRIVPQRTQFRRLFGDAAQLKDGPEEKELLQGKFQPIQQKGPEEEKVLQGKCMPVQRKGPEEELLQGKFAKKSTPVQLEGDPAKQENRTGLPDNLKAGIESLSGFSLDDVRVHYNSSKPAQLQAFAYAQGTEIHVGPGQEQHLPHEAWHVVQQKQGRVQPTMQMKDGIAVNDDAGLEHEADMIGAKALTEGGKHQSLLQLKCDACAEEDAGHAQKVVSRMRAPSPFQLVRNGIHGNVVQLANCYFFKNDDCQGKRIRAQSKHNFADYATYNCSGERGGEDCVVNDGKGECFCPNLEEEERETGGKPGKSDRVSAYDDPTTSRDSRALIERGLETGEYPPRRR